MSFSLKQIRYFISAAETGQVTHASTNLNVSQSAVTTAIKSLEQFLQIQLFERHANGITLTYEGNQCLYRARNIMSAVEEATRFPKRINEDITGVLRLVFTYTVAGYFIPTILARFKKNFPNIELHLSEAPRNEIEEGLISGKYDLAIMLTSNLLNQEDIAFETLFKSKRRLWVSSDHKFLSAPSVSLQDVSNEPYIMLAVDEASNTAQRYWNRTPYRPDTIFRTSSVEAVRSLVASGVGVTILSDMVYRPWSLEGLKIDVLPLADDIPSMDVGFAWIQNKDFCPQEKAFLEFVYMSDNNFINSKSPPF